MYIFIYIYIYRYIFYRHETNFSALYKVATLSEYQVCRELLWMFYVQTSMVVFQQESRSKFSIRFDVSLPSLTTVSIFPGYFVILLVLSFRQKNHIYANSLLYYLKMLLPDCF